MQLEAGKSYKDADGDSWRVTATVPYYVDSFYWDPAAETFVVAAGGEAAERVQRAYGPFTPQAKSLHDHAEAINAALAAAAADGYFLDDGDAHVPHLDLNRYSPGMYLADAWVEITVPEMEA